MADDNLGFDLYEELEISPRASQEVIQAAYRRLARLYHPDSGDRPDASHMVRLNQAFSTLNDPERRRRYDVFLARSAPETRPRSRSAQGTPPGSAKPNSATPPGQEGPKRQTDSSDRGPSQQRRSGRQEGKDQPTRRSSTSFVLWTVGVSVALVAVLAVGGLTAVYTGPDPFDYAEVAWTMPDDRNDFGPTSSDGEAVKNPDSAGDIVEMLVAVLDGNTRVTITFAGAAEGLMSKGGEELSAVLQFFGDERFIMILFGEDGSVGFFDPLPDSRVSSKWPAPNTLVFDVTRMEPSEGTVVRFATVPTSSNSPITTIGTGNQRGRRTANASPSRVTGMGTPRSL
jgi:curved DNA-binding protein CbpA